MNLTFTKRRWLSIALFYVTAVAVRAVALHFEVTDTNTFLYWLWRWARGIGPCLGAVAAVIIFKRDFYCSITGTSILKSVLTVLLPFGICFFLNRNLSYTMLGFVFYSFLEEVGWRGYLQGELKDMNTALRVLIIGLMWFFWHIAINFSVGGLIFLAVLVLGSWGIGCIARDTNSLAACACFHALYNFSAESSITFTPSVVAIYVAVVACWFVIWYVPWRRVISPNK